MHTNETDIETDTARRICIASLGKIRSFCQYTDSLFANSIIADVVMSGLRTVMDSYIISYYIGVHGTVHCDRI